MTQRTVILVLVAAALLVIARTALFLIWEQSAFDSDQAIFGLMAKHIVEGRAFPVFIYGDNYMLSVQAWLAAPLFAIFGPSVALLKLPVFFVNIATGVLLVWILIRDAKLSPLIALITSLFFVLMPPVMSKLLMETGGGNPEPFLYVLVLWLLRDRPIAFGVVLAVGFMHREFTIYGVTAIVLISWLGDRRLNIERIKAVAIAGVVFFAVSQAIRTAFLFSNPFGPGTTAGAASLEGSALGGRYCWAPETIAPALGEMLSRFMGLAFGATEYPLREFGLRSLNPSVPFGLPSFWPVLGAIFAIALTRVVWIAARDRAPIWKGPAAVGSMLLLIGLQSAVVYAVARCGRLEPGTFRYALLMLYAGVGIVALFFVYERQRVLRGAMVAVMLAWAAISAASHGLLFEEYVNREPGSPHRALANYLVEHDVRYARSDYWTAYITTFMTGERSVIASTDTVRIDEYQQQVSAHDETAMIVQRQSCTGPGAEAVKGNYWVCEPRK
jgi:hypothetical protein